MPTPQPCFPNPSTSAIFSTAASASSVNILTSNVNRRKIFLFNNSDSPVRVAFGVAASVSIFSFLLQPNRGYESELSCFTGNIFAIWEIATGNMLATELTV